jgi:surface antigen
MNKVFSKLTLSAIVISIAFQAHTAKADRGTIVAATIGGAIIGGLIGSSIAQDFDDNDNRQAQRMWSQALNNNYSDSPYAWDGQGHRGRIVFTGEGYFDGYYCRNYRSEVWNRRSNTPMITRGYVCRAADGSWFRREESEITQSRPGRPDRGQRFDPPRPNMPDGRRDDRRDGPRYGGRQPQQPGMGNGPGRGMGGGMQGGMQQGGYGPGRGNGGYSQGGYSGGSGTVTTNGDALPIGVQ